MSTATASTPEAALVSSMESADAQDSACVLPCHRGNPDLWFAESPADLERAKQLCAPCPIREACLAGALERGEPWGVWGGEIFDRGAVIARKRPRGRPRKNATVPQQRSSAA
ncbi:WhiB family transcriptional regulator [Haloechinothrix salitolerans]|uniref:Transcriptional regulator WhiB n=1 Tax=Haloechinothrix salitolerans TaxID=926830 RepID=A0ABW2C8S8_9PSEU